MDAISLLKADHRSVEQLFQQFENAGDRAFATKAKVLIEPGRHHVIEEVEDLFPKVADGLSPERLDELGDEAEKAKAVVATRSRPNAPDAPDTPAGKAVAGLVSVVIDRATVLVESVKP